MRVDFQINPKRSRGAMGPAFGVTHVKWLFLAVTQRPETQIWFESSKQPAFPFRSRPAFAFQSYIAGKNVFHEGGKCG